jgi:hypothetical protein
LAIGLISSLIPVAIRQRKTILFGFAIKTLHWGQKKLPERTSNRDSPDYAAIKSLFFERFGLTVVSWLLLANL